MTSKGRAGVVLVVAALVATGIGALVVFREEDDALRTEAAPIADAAVDARAIAKAKPKPAGKKKPARGGKTRVAGRAAPAPATAVAATHAAHAASPPVPRPRRASAPSGPSYESALASNDQHVTIGASTGPDLTDAQLSAPMSDGAFLDACGAPESMGVTVKVAIAKGRAVGVTVSTDPPSADVASCIDHHVRGLSWPSSAKMDSFVTTY